MCSEQEWKCFVYEEYSTHVGVLEGNVTCYKYHYHTFVPWIGGEEQGTALCVRVCVCVCACVRVYVATYVAADPIKL